MLIGYNPGDATYMTCYQNYDFLGNERFSEAIGSESYVEIMDVFLQRLREQPEKVRAFQAERAIPVTVLGREHCLPYTEEFLKGKLIIIRPPALRWSTALLTASLGMRWAASAALPALVDVRFISRNCIPVRSAGGILQMFSALLTAKSCLIGQKKNWWSMKRAILRRKRSEVRHDEL